MAATAIAKKAPGKYFKTFIRYHWEFSFEGLPRDWPSTATSAIAFGLFIGSNALGYTVGRCSRRHDATCEPEGGEFSAS